MKDEGWRMRDDGWRMRDEDEGRGGRLCLTPSRIFFSRRDKGETQSCAEKVV